MRAHPLSTRTKPEPSSNRNNPKRCLFQVQVKCCFFDSTNTHKLAEVDRLLVSTCQRFECSCSALSVHLDRSGVHSLTGRLGTAWTCFPTLWLELPSSRTACPSESRQCLPERASLASASSPLLGGGGFANNSTSPRVRHLLRSRPQTILSMAPPPSVLSSCRLLEPRCFACTLPFASWWLCFNESSHLSVTATGVWRCGRGRG